MGNKRLIRRALICLAGVVVLCLAPLCFGETVIVRVLGEADGEPLVRQAVTVRLHYGNKTTVVHELTDFSGEATIDLSRIKPEALSVSVKLDTDYYSCTCRVKADTDTVLSKGLARDGHGKSLKLFNDAPKEIIFLARPASIRKRLIYVLAGSQPPR